MYPIMYKKTYLYEYITIYLRPTFMSRPHWLEIFPNESNLSFTLNDSQAVISRPHWVEIFAIYIAKKLYIPPQHFCYKNHKLIIPKCTGRLTKQIHWNIIYQKLIRLNGMSTFSSRPKTNKFYDLSLTCILARL